MSQQWQYFRNAWFHPHIAAGAHLAWESNEYYFHPVYSYDPVTRTSATVEPPRRERGKTELRVRPFVATGFKGYITRRAFFRSDVRAGFGDGFDELLLRFGFGVDF